MGKFSPKEVEGILGRVGPQPYLRDVGTVVEGI